jgi:hypothetical protein
MNTKQALAASVISLTALALGLLSAPFIGSLQPSNRASANLPTMDLSMIEPGNFQLLPHPTGVQLHHGFEVGLLVYRTHTGEFYLWDVPAKEGKVGMPDISWWRPFYLCKNFGPAIRAGRVDESQPIECHDTQLPSSWWAREWRWSINGEALGSHVDDMQNTAGTLESQSFVFSQRPL